MSTSVQKNTEHISARLLVCFCLSIALISYVPFIQKCVDQRASNTKFFQKSLQSNQICHQKQTTKMYRSAFTYCEDDPPSRIDFGKSKYEGPFTTEQVEDVKTFFRLLSFICLGCTLPSTNVAVNQLVNYLTYYDNQITNPVIRTCHFDKFHAHVTSPTLIALLIPLYEFAIYPVFRRHFCWENSHLKILFGVFLQTARVIALMF